MRLAIAQINTTVGDFAGNTRRILSFARQALRRECDMVVYPELAIPGYPPRDLVEKEDFIDANLAALDEITRRLPSGLTAAIGFIDRNAASTGKPLFNAVAVIRDGRRLSTHYKSLLPTYDVFDEGRYFEPAPRVLTSVVVGRRLGVTICEDVWNDKHFWRKRLYHHDPVERLGGEHVDVLLNVSASPFSIGKLTLREQMLREIATELKAPVVYANLVGGDDCLIFDGASFVVDAAGRKIAQARDFDEDLVVCDTDEAAGDMRSVSGGEIESTYRALVLGTADYCRKNGFKKAVIGLSGGIDSALTACIATAALGRHNVLGVTMPSRYSSPGSVDDSERLAHNLGIEIHRVPIRGLQASYLRALVPLMKGRAPDVTEENLQARIRGDILMAISNKFGHLVLSTGNKSELAVGYCTMYGDMCGGLAVISDVPKLTVYQLANYVNREREVIPSSTISKAPSAELRPGQLDEDALPPYKILDPIIRLYVEEDMKPSEIVSQGYDARTVEEVVRLIHRSEYKRQQAAPGLRVTSKAFGYGRRFPIAEKFHGGFPARRSAAARRGK